jgi:hypothetical protein
MNKEEVLQLWSEYYEKHFELQDGTDSDSGESGQCAYKRQNRMLNHHTM